MFASVVSVEIVPLRTRKTLIRPANGSAIVLKTKAAVSRALDLDRRALLGGAGDALDEQVEERGRAEILGRHRGGDGEHLAARDCVLERFGDFLVRELLPVQVALHQPLVRLDDGVEELLPVLGCEIGDLRRDLRPAALTLAVRARVRAHVQDVDDAGQLVLEADRDVHGDAVRRQLGANPFERAEEVGALAIEHVHDHDTGDVPVLAAVPGSPRADLDAHHAADDDELALDDAERGDRVALEAGVAGRVDQVDLAALPLTMAERGGQGHLPPVLVLIPVGDGRALLDRAEPVDRTGLEQHRLHEGRLARPSVADGGDVADLSGLLSRHARGVPL